MRRSLPAFAIVVAMLALVLLAVGCSKPPPAAQGPSAPTPMAKTPASGPPAQLPAAEPSAPAAPAAGGDLASIMDVRKGLTSYVQTTTINGKAIRTSVKLQGGKPVALHSDAGKPQSWMLILLDKQVNYLVDAGKKTAIKMSMKSGAETGQPPQGPSAPDLSKLQAQHPKITSDTLDGLACWKIEVSGPEGKPTTTWVDKQYGLTRQAKTGDSTIKFAYDKINAVPDSEFELPPGTKIMDLPGAVPGKPAMPVLPPKPAKP